MKRHPSGLLESCDEEPTERNPKCRDQSNQRNENVRNDSEHQMTELYPPNDDESPTGGDKKRRCVEACNYDDDSVIAGKREPQPASAFKPKCLNFDDVEDS